jgi:hypothetical protein
VWDTVSERWVETDFLNVGLDQVVSGLVNGDVPEQRFTRLTVTAALPGTPNENAMYFIPGGGIYLGSVLIAGTGWEAAGDPNGIVNSNSGNVILATLPSSDPGVPGALWNNAGVVNISI